MRRNKGTIHYKLPVQGTGTTENTRLRQRYRAFSVGNPAEAFKKGKGRFDSVLFRFVQPYIWNRKLFNDVYTYLENLEDEEYGLPFGRNYYIRDDLDVRIRKFEGNEARDFRWNKHYREGKAKVLARYSRAHLRMLEPHNDEEAMALIRDKDTSVGYLGIVNPDVGKKKDVADNAFGLLSDCETFARKNHTFGIPYIPWYRSGAKDGIGEEGQLPTDHKCSYQTRPVWIDDVVRVMSGARATVPISEWYKTYQYVGHGKSDEYLNRMLTNWNAHPGCTIESDYSSYDSTIPSWLIYDAFDVIYAMFDYIDRDLWEAWRNDFITKQFYDPINQCFVDITHGDPSGSAWTSIINDVCHELILETVHAAYPLYEWEHDYDVYTVTGDDEVEKMQMMPYDIAVKYAEWKSHYITANFGVVCKPSAVVVRRSCQRNLYLSRFWTDEGPYRCGAQCISKMLYPERFRDYGSGKVKPEIVMFSYILCYGAGMAEVFDTRKFLNDFGLTRKELDKLSPEEVKELPYVVREWYLNKSGMTR